MTDHMSLRSLKVGDEIVVTDPNRPAFRLRVERIGRMYLYTRERCPGFDIDTGRQNDNCGNTYALTPQAYEHRQRIDAARDAIHALHGARYSMPADRLLAIHDVLKEKGLL